MGTRGYKVYRYRRVCWVQYNHWDSYPSGLGLDLLATIPKDPKEFSIWLEEKKIEFDEEYSAWQQKGYNLETTDEYDSFFRAQAPCNDLFIEWVYEFDLDNLVFHVDSMPLFRLDNMPERDDFIAWISFDNYGQRSYAYATPPEYRYEGVLRKPTPPISAESLSEYASLSPKIVSWADIIPDTEKEAIPDSSRVLSELLVASILNINRALIFDWQAKGPTESILPEERAIAHSLFAICASPKNWVDTESLSIFFQPGGGSDKIWWPTDRVCVFLRGQLFDENTIMDAVVTVVDAIKSKGLPLAVAVIFSVVHVIIVRVGRDGSIRRTAPLPFLPSAFATNPATHGISALVSLGSWVLRECVFRAIHRRVHQSATIEDLPLAESHRDLPNELISDILGFVDARTLRVFASLSNLALDLAFPFLSQPTVISSRRTVVLEKPVALPSEPNDEEHGVNDDGDEEGYGQGRELKVLTQAIILSSVIDGEQTPQVQKAKVLLEFDLPSPASIVPRLYAGIPVGLHLSLIELVPAPSTAPDSEFD